MSAHERLNELNDRLDAKTRLMQDVAHELKNPLSVIHGYASFLSKETVSPADMRKALRAIQSNAERVIAGLRPKFRLCYNQGLAQDPGRSGSVTMVVKIAPNGEVDSANAANNSGLSDSVVKCIQRALKNAQFDAPGSSGSVLQVPAKFVKQ